MAQWDPQTRLTLLIRLRRYFPAAVRGAARVGPIVPRIIWLQELISKNDILAFCWSRMGFNRLFLMVSQTGGVYTQSEPGPTPSSCPSSPHPYHL